MWLTGICMNKNIILVTGLLSFTFFQMSQSEQEPNSTESFDISPGKDCMLTLYYASKSGDPKRIEKAVKECRYLFEESFESACDKKDYEAAKEIITLEIEAKKQCGNATKRKLLLLREDFL